MGKSEIAKRVERFRSGRISEDFEVVQIRKGITVKDVHDSILDDVSYFESRLRRDIAND